MMPKLSQFSSTFSTAPSHFTTFWREPHRQAAKDIRRRWRRCALWILLAAWLALLLFAFAVLIAPNSGVDSGSQPACLPDDSFALDPSKFRFFSKSGFFQITLGFGHMNFTEVKTIDIAWDILVGRGGQALVAYISWRVFAQYVTTSMEVTPVTFGTYRTIFLPNGGLLVSTLCMIRDFVRRHGLHSKIAMVFMVCTMTFTFVYPTIASAMTGYSANVDAFIQTTGGEYVPFNAFSFAYFVIHDGSRIGLEDDHIALDKDPEKSNYQYAAEYGFNRGDKINSTFGGQLLPPPTLNISAPSLVRTTEYEDYSYASYEDRLFRVTNDPSQMLWAYDNKTYDFKYLQGNGKCQAALDYKWGFSYIQLFIMVIFHIVWTLGLFTMWIRACMVMKKRGRGREDVAGENKAVFELAAAMREQMNEPTKEEGDDVSALTEAKLRRRITKDLRGGSISYTTPILPNGDRSEKWNAMAWMKSHKLSIIAMIVCVAAMMINLFAWVPDDTGTVALLPLPTVLIAALYIGSTRGSRIVLFTWIFILVVIPTQITVSIATY
ncbi:hypothetical protein AA0120_g1957 [Alternaria tenuissima]|nr:hypothetical protein AA0120_g1957 [Alternaria tenuissima]